MGDRSYVNLAEGISAVSYVWLCTCMQMHFVIGMASSCLKARLLAKQPGGYVHFHGDVERLAALGH